MLFLLSKLLSPFIEPDFIFLAMILGGLLLSWSHWPNAGRWIALVGASLLLAIALLPLHWWIGAPLEDRFPIVRELPPQVDGIIVLGGAVDPIQTQRRGIASLNDGAEVMTAAVELARLRPAAKLVFSGGAGPSSPDSLKESDVARQFFLDFGIDSARLILERQSRNTYENAVFSKSLVDPRPGEIWILVTSALHMPRSVGIFRRIGWDVVPWPVAYKTYGDDHGGLGEHVIVLDSALHEWVGLLAYRVLGRTNSFFHGPTSAGQ